MPPAKPVDKGQVLIDKLYQLVAEPLRKILDGPNSLSASGNVMGNPYGKDCREKGIDYHPIAYFTTDALHLAQIMAGKQTKGRFHVVAQSIPPQVAKAPIEDKDNAPRVSMAAVCREGWSMWGGFKHKPLSSRFQALCCTDFQDNTKWGSGLLEDEKNYVAALQTLNMSSWNVSPRSVYYFSSAFLTVDGASGLAYVYNQPEIEPYVRKVNGVLAQGPQKVVGRPREYEDGILFLIRAFASTSFTADEFANHLRKMDEALAKFEGRKPNEPSSQIQFIKVLAFGREFNEVRDEFVNVMKAAATLKANPKDKAAQEAMTKLAAKIDELKKHLIGEYINGMRHAALPIANSKITKSELTPDQQEFLVAMIDECRRMAEDLEGLRPPRRGCVGPNCGNPPPPPPVSGTRVPVATE